MCGKAQHFLGTHCVPASPVEMLSTWAARSLAGFCILVYTPALTGSMTHVEVKERAVGWADEGCGTGRRGVQMSPYLLALSLEQTTGLGFPDLLKVEVRW